MKSFKNWLENFDSGQRNTYNITRETLDFNKLNNKAIRITQPGAGTSDEKEVENNNDEWSFSIVTPFNKSAWRHWPTKPISEKYVLKTNWLNGKQSDGKPNLDDAKYMQIVTAAKQLGVM